MAKINVFSAENPGRIDVGEAMGSKDTLMYIYDVPPGRSSCPYHYEYDEEWMLVLDGTLVVRTPDGEVTLERGDIVFFPAGPAGAHKIMNRAEVPARMMMFSHRRGLAIAVYPDSDKIGVFPDEETELIFKRGTAVPYWEGEEGWESAV